MNDNHKHNKDTEPGFIKSLWLSIIYIGYYIWYSCLSIIKARKEPDKESDNSQKRKKPVSDKDAKKEGPADKKKDPSKDGPEEPSKERVRLALFIMCVAVFCLLFYLGSKDSRQNESMGDKGNFELTGTAETNEDVYTTGSNYDPDFIELLNEIGKDARNSGESPGRLVFVPEKSLVRLIITSEHPPKAIDVFQSDQEEIKRIKKIAREYGIPYSQAQPPGKGYFSSWIWFFLIMLAVYWFMMKRMGAVGGGKGGFQCFSKSKAKLITEKDIRITFDDVAGVDDAKEELQEVMDFLHDPERFRRVGARMPRGILLLGRPGTGKTLMARAVAGECGVPFFSISGSNFVEMFVGVGAARVRDLFEQAKKNAPCVIFIDELDAVGRHRGAGLGGGHDEKEQTLNQMLVELDGFDASAGIIMIGATNRPDVLDPALTRPGRFDKQVVLPIPDLKAREAILKVHMRGKPFTRDVNPAVVVKGIFGFTGADIENLTNEAALLAAKERKKRISGKHLEGAVDRVILGLKGHPIPSEEEKRIVAYHEAGHALIGALISNDPIHKVSIVPRGMALGITASLPAEDRRLESEDRLQTAMAILMGGRCAERIIFNDNPTTGAGNDLERATEIARRMVCEFGMSKLGERTFGQKQGEIFLAKQLGHEKDYSEETAREIDKEIDRFVDEARQKASELLKENRDKLDAIAELLLEKEEISGEEVMKIVN